jgi:regulator of protease activity HflC (stomatin/prohibitin superfamily)
MAKIDRASCEALARITSSEEAHLRLKAVELAAGIHSHGDNEARFIIAEAEKIAVSAGRELERRFETAVPDGPQLLEEILRLRGHLSFHESRIKDMHRHLSGEP